MADIIRLRNPNAFLLPDVAEFIQTATKNVRYRTAYNKIMNSVTKDHVALFLAREDGEWKGFAWVDSGTWEDDGIATVLHFYSTGGKPIREPLIEAVVNFAKAGGATRLLAWDMNKKPGAFARIFRSAGTVKETMRAYEFDLNNARV